MRIPSAPALRADKEPSVEQQCLCDDLFPWSLRVVHNKAELESGAAWAAPSLCCSSGLTSGFQELWALFWHYFAGIVSSIAD